MKNKISIIGKSLLWCLIVLLFPVVSGTFSVIFSLDSIETLFLQGGFMVMSLIPPVVFVLCRKWKFNEIGFGKFKLKSRIDILYLLIPFVIFIPVAIKGFYVKSAEYVLGNLFLYLFVGIAEEVYFRGIIPRYLKQGFQTKGVIILSTVIFGVGHITTALSGSGAFEIVLIVLNALIFGWLAIELSIISSNIYIPMLIHFLFDFETKIVVVSGKELLIAEIARGALMFVLAAWFAVVIYKRKNCQRN